MVALSKETNLSWLNGYEDSLANKFLFRRPSLGVNSFMTLTVGPLGIFTRPLFEAPEKLSL